VVGLFKKMFQMEYFFVIGEAYPPFLKLPFS
jgi:hypothetical protein